MAQDPIKSETKTKQQSSNTRFKAEDGGSENRKRHREGVVAPTSNGIGERSKRQATRSSCCVETCRNHGKSVPENGEAIKFFEMPSHDRKLRALWENAIPGIRDAALSQHRKVCEEHFVDGTPTAAHPAPELKLGDELPQLQKTPKEKSDSKKAKKVAPLSPNSSLKTGTVKPISPATAEIVDTLNSVQPSVRSPRTITISASAVSSKKNCSTSVIETAVTTVTSGLCASSSSVTEAHANAVMATGREHCQEGAFVEDKAPDSAQQKKNSATCWKCSGSLPFMKRSLGRMESQLDSMVTMVRTIFQQETGLVPGVGSASPYYIPQSGQNYGQIQARSGFLGSGTGTAQQIIADVISSSGKKTTLPTSKDISSPASSGASTTVSAGAAFPTSHCEKVSTDISREGTGASRRTATCSASLKAVEPIFSSAPLLTPMISVSNISKSNENFSVSSMSSAVSSTVSSVGQKKLVLPPGFMLKSGSVQGNKAVRIVIKKPQEYYNRTEKPVTTSFSKSQETLSEGKSTETKMEEGEIVFIGGQKYMKRRASEVDLQQDASKKNRTTHVTEKFEHEEHVLQNQSTKNKREVSVDVNAASSTEVNEESSCNNANVERNVANVQRNDSLDTSSQIMHEEDNESRTPNDVTRGSAGPQKEKSINDPKFYLTNAVARSMLLHSGQGFALSQLVAYGPLWLPKVPEPKLESVVNELVEQGLLIFLGKHKIDNLDKDDKGEKISTVYKKTPGQQVKEYVSLQKKLSKYGVSVQAYVNSFKLKGFRQFPKVAKILELHS